MNEPSRHQTQPTRSPTGQYVPNPETAHTDAEAARLRGRGQTYRQIAAAMGWSHPQSAHDAVRRARASIVTEAAEESIAFELDRLDEMHQAALRVLEAHHIVVSNGKVIDLGGVPLEDHGPVLAAIDRVVKISESRRRLLGLDQPAKTQLSGALTYQVVGVTSEDLS